MLQIAEKEEELILIFKILRNKNTIYENLLFLKIIKLNVSSETEFTNFYPYGTLGTISRF